MGTYLWINIDSGNGLLPDGTKPLPEPMSTYHQWGSVARTRLRPISQEMLKISIRKMNSKNTLMTLFSHLSWAKGLSGVISWYTIRKRIVSDILDVMTW